MRIQRFKALADVTLGRYKYDDKIDELPNFVCLIGPNGSGKSTVLDAFGFLADCLAENVEAACDKPHRGGFQKLRTQGETGPIQFDIYYRENEKARPISYTLAIEEVESWYLGDLAAMKRAFNTVDKKPLAGYEQDSTCGAWELFKEVIKDRLERKPYWARKMGVELDVDNLEHNRSPSFQTFCRGVRRHAGELESPASPEKKRVEERSRRTQKRVKSKR